MEVSEIKRVSSLAQTAVDVFKEWAVYVSRTTRRLVALRGNDAFPRMLKDGTLFRFWL